MLLIVLLSFLLLFTIVFANTQNPTFADNVINLDNCSGNIYLTSAGDYMISGSSKDIAIIVITNGDISLNLNNVHMRSKNGPCIIVEEAQTAVLNFVENTKNIFETTGNQQFKDYSATIYSRDNLIFDGLGNTLIQSEIGHGVKGNDSIEFLNGSYEIDCIEDAIHANDNVIIHDGSFVLKTDDKGLRAERNLEIHNGCFTINSIGDAIRAEDTLSIHGGIIDIVSDSEGMEAKNEIIINNGKVNIESKDDGINAKNKITINNGNLRIISTENDAIDSNGAIIVNDGVVYASGFKSPEGAIDCDAGVLQINGGTIMGIGRMNSYYNVGYQNILMINPEKDEYIKNIKIRHMNDVVFEYNLHDYKTEQNSATIGLPSPITRPFNNDTNLLGCSVSLFISCPELITGHYSIFFNDIFFDNVEIVDKYTILGAEPVLKFPK